MGGEVLFLVTAALWLASGLITDEEEATLYIRKLDRISGKRWHNLSVAQWNYETNLTDYNNQVEIQVEAYNAQQEKLAFANTSQYDWQNFQNETLKRWFKMFGRLDDAALPDAELAELKSIINGMVDTYDTATICDYKNRSKCDLLLFPDLIDLFSTSTDPEELKYIFLEWSRVAGAAIKSNFTRYVELKNQAAVLNNFSSTAEWWLSNYETTDFEAEIASNWAQFKPLYQQFHAFVRGKLRAKYGSSIVSERGPIPAHLLGDIWGLIWIYLPSEVIPYPNAKIINITQALIDQNYTALSMVQQSDMFQQSMNLSAMPDLFYNRSIFTQPTDGRDFDCHESAWNFFRKKKPDFRLKACIEITEDFYHIVYHEMGHIRYYLQYMHQPFGFRDGANLGFHEAIGDTFALSVFSPTHLSKIGLISETDMTSEIQINNLFMQGLDRIAFIPFGYMFELWRYSIFRGTTKPDDYNCHYWHYKVNYQGLEPPANRSDPTDFDGGAKYHTAADAEYLEYVVAYLLQFQFHRRLCEIAGQYSTIGSASQLFNCDVGGSAAAGNAFGDMLSLGSSKPWPDTLEQFAGTRQLSASGILEYFQPLMDWLTAENERTGEYVGWENSTVQYCSAEQVAAGLPVINN